MTYQSEEGGHGARSGDLEAHRHPYQVFRGTDTQFEISLYIRQNKYRHFATSLLSPKQQHAELRHMIAQACQREIHQWRLGESPKPRPTSSSPDGGRQKFLDSLLWLVQCWLHGFLNGALDEQGGGRTRNDP